MKILLKLFLTATLIGCCFFYSEAQSYAKLDDKTWALYDKGDLAGALENAQKALRQAQKEFGQKHSKTAEAMFTVALFLEFNGYSRDAEKYYLDALEMTRQTDGEKSEAYVYGLEMVGGYYTMNQNYEKAIQYYRQNLNVCETVFGNKGEEYANSLNNLGVNLDLAGYYSEAVVLLEEAYVLMKKLAGENDLKTANYCKDLAHAYSNAGDYQKAVSHYQIALKIREKAGKVKDQAYADLLNQLGMTHASYNNNQEAEKYLLQSLELTKNNYGINSPNYANTLNNLAQVYENTGKHELSLKTYQEALSIFEKTTGKESTNYLSALNNLAGLYAEMGQMVEATRIYEDVMSTRKKLFGENSSDYAFSLNDLALIYAKRGDTRKAEDLMLQALEIRLNLSGKETPDYTTTLNNLAVLFHETGRYDKSEAAHLECLELKKKVYGQYTAEVARSMVNLASLYDDLGNLNKTYDYLTKAISILDNPILTDKKLLTTAYNNMGNYYLASHKYDVASQYFEKSLNIRKEIYGENHPDYATGLYQLGLLYEEIGQSDKSAENFEKCLAVYQKTIGKDNLTYAKALSNLATAYSSLGKFAQAETEYLNAKNIIENKSGKKNIDYLNILNNLGYLYVDMNKPEKAEAIYLESNQLMIEVIRNTISFLSETEKEAYMATVANNFKAINSFYYTRKDIKPELAGKLIENEMFINGLLLGAETSMRSKIQNSKDEKLIQIYDKWLNIKKELAVNYTKPYDQRDKNLPQMEAEANDLEKQLYQLSADFKSVNENAVISWKKIQENLAENEAFIQFVNFELFEQYLTGNIIYCAAIVTKKMNQPKIVYLGNEKDLMRIIGTLTKDKNQFVNTLYAASRGAGSSTQTVKYTGYKGDSLYKYIWKPIQPYLAGIKTLYLVPSGLLHQISFAALPGDQARYLCQQFNINSLSSARFLAEEKSKAVKGTDVNVFNIFGGIDYNSNFTGSKQSGDDIFQSTPDQIPIQSVSRGEEWNYLPGTLEESSKIEQSAKTRGKQINLITGKNATEEKIKQLSGNKSPDVLHIATHGFFFPDTEVRQRIEENVFKSSENPLFRSGLLFAGGNLSWQGKKPPEGVDDGILTAYEVSTLDLNNTKLVVLSACETGLGEIKGSEGVYGLQRAFKKAGVSYLIMSLWQVPDKETSEFMQTFYNKWLAGNTIRQAFADTQKEMSSKYSPYYWAAFVLLH